MNTWREHYLPKLLNGIGKQLQDIIFDEDDLNEAMMDIAKQCGIQKDKLTENEIVVYKKYSNLIIRKVAAYLGLPCVA